MHINFILLLLSFGCATSQGVYRKGRILDASMDPGKTEVASRQLQHMPNGLWEKSQNVQSLAGKACPTCGS